MAADWITRDMHLIFWCIFFCADTSGHILTLPAAHSHNSAGEIQSVKLDQKRQGLSERLGKYYSGSQI